MAAAMGQLGPAFQKLLQESGGQMNGLMGAADNNPNGLPWDMTGQAQPNASNYMPMGEDAKYGGPDPLSGTGAYQQAPMASMGGLMNLMNAAPPSKQNRKLAEQMSVDRYLQSLMGD